MWFTDLVDYYGVNLKDAIILGTRKKGRKPNLPGSPTCQPVSGMTFEELWDSKPRETIQQKMDFYKDIGAWQVFRQCFYRKDFDFTDIALLIEKGDTVLEYGCGVAPVTNWLIENYRELVNNVKFELVDVTGEHLEFAKWRFNRKAPDINITYHKITEEHPLPEFKNSINVALMLDVMEHLPNPLAVIENVYNSMNKKSSILMMNWESREGNTGAADFSEAEAERDEVFKFINKNLTPTGTKDLYMV